MLGDGVRIGAFAYIGPEVELASGVEDRSPRDADRADPRLGADGQHLSRTPAWAVAPQDREASAAKSTSSRDRRALRPPRARDRSTSARMRAGGCTRLGDDNFVMNSAHVGHDCQIGERHDHRELLRTRWAYAVVDDFAVLGAYTGLHQHRARRRVGDGGRRREGRLATRPRSPWSRVIVPAIVGLNSVGLQATRALERQDACRHQARLPSDLPVDGFASKRR